MSSGISTLNGIPELNIRTYHLWWGYVRTIYCGVIFTIFISSARFAHYLFHFQQCFFKESS